LRIQFVALVAVLLLASGCVRAQEVPGLPATVLSIGDGDSIRVRLHGQMRKVRLACIDAPELDQVPQGAASRAYLQSRLRQGSQVRLLPYDTDRHGRLVAEVIGDTNLNLALVEDGQAFVFPKHVHQCDAAEFRAAERRASRASLGIWRFPGGITRPWEFRRQQRSDPGAESRRDVRL
jgi:endonuclease YncB( thermonuclease family)